MCQHYARVPENVFTCVFSAKANAADRSFSHISASFASTDSSSSEILALPVTGGLESSVRKMACRGSFRGAGLTLNERVTLSAQQLQLLRVDPRALTSLTLLHLFLAPSLRPVELTRQLSSLLLRLLHLRMDTPCSVTDRRTMPSASF